jgi:hypothetical protein
MWPHTQHSSLDSPELVADAPRVQFSTPPGLGVYLANTIPPAHQRYVACACARTRTTSLSTVPTPHPIHGRQQKQKKIGKIIASQSDQSDRLRPNPKPKFPLRVDEDEDSNPTPTPAASSCGRVRLDRWAVTVGQSLLGKRKGWFGREWCDGQPLWILWMNCEKQGSSGVATCCAREFLHGFMAFV